MQTDFLRAVKLSLWLFILCSIIYTFFIWGVGKIFFPFQAGGSIIYKNSKPIGSLLIGEKFNSPYLFDSRPSSAGSGYQANESSGSNYGPTNAAYIGIVKKRVKTFLKENPTVKKGEIPVDLMTGSGSGLGPFISIEGALVQIPRISRLTGIKQNVLKKLLFNTISNRTFGIFGTPGVNTVKINLKLASLIKAVKIKLYLKIFKGLSNK